MKYSNTAITQLTRWYKQILIKCAIFNAAILLGGAVIASPAMAERLVPTVETTVSDTVYSNNVVSEDNGGGIKNNQNLTANNVTVQSNTQSGKRGGGGAYIYGNGKTTVFNNSVIGGDEVSLGNTAKNGGGIFNYNATLSVNGTAIKNNEATAGGGIFNAKDGTLSIVGGSIDSNIAQAQGGGIYNKGSLTVNGTTFSNNKVTGYEYPEIGTISDGGAIYSDSVITVKNATFNNNSANYGGAIAGSGGTIENSTFTGNSATQYAVYVDAVESAAGITIKDSIIEENTAQGTSAVGLFARNLTSTIDNTQFINNNSTGTEYGQTGALFLGSEASVTVKDSTFDGNTSALYAGAIGTRTLNVGNNSAGKLTITDTEFKNNTAGTNGGAINNNFYHSDAEGHTDAVYVAGSEFNSNSAEKGGAIYNHAGQDGDILVDGNKQVGNMYIADSTFTGNTATSKGGAVYNEGEITLNNSTFTGNSSTGNSGAIAQHDVNSVLTLNNTQFNSNSADWGGAIVARGIVNITGGSFEENHSNDGGGAIYLATLANKGHKLSIDGTTFAKNYTKGVGLDGGGAIGSFSDLVISNAEFTENKVEGSSDGGGAIFLGSVSTNDITDTKFIKNTSTTGGGAIGSRTFAIQHGDNSGATLDINASSFELNSATNGGAIDNYLYNDKNNDGYVKITASSFDSNSATNGGAIYNHKGSGTDIKVDGNHQVGNMYIKDSTFTGNTATTAGAAIYNEGIVTLAGTNTFSGNTANGVANDIYNTGTLNINGKATLAGGIDGSGGTVNVAGDVEVSTIKNQTVAHNSGELHITNGAADGSNLSGSTVTVASDAIINTIDDVINDYMTGGDGKGKITLQSGAQIKGDIDFVDGTADKYASAAGTVKYVIGNLISDIGKGSKTIQVASSGTKVDVSEAKWSAQSGATFVSSDAYDGNIVVAGFAGGIEDAADASSTIQKVNYDFSEDESVNTAKTLHNNVQIDGDGVSTLTLNADFGTVAGATAELNDMNLSGTGHLGNAAGAVMRINDSVVDVVVDNNGVLISDPTTYTDTVNNTGIASFDADTFTGTATLNNTGTASLSNGVTFETGASITGTGVTNLVSGYTYFNDTANANTINLVSGANFDGKVIGGTMNTQNGVIDAIAGSVQDMSLALDVNTSTATMDKFASVSGSTIKSLNVSGAYGTTESVSVAMGTGMSLASDAVINGGYYTKVKVDGSNLVFSDKLVNTSTIRGELDSSSNPSGTVVLGDRAATTTLGTAKAQVALNNTAETVAVTAANGMTLNGNAVLTTANVAGTYSGTTIDEADAYIETNAGKFANVGTTAGVINTIFKDKQDWLDGTLGITSANPDAVKTAYTGTNYLANATTLTGADKLLDKTINDVSTIVGPAQTTAATTGQFVGRKIGADINLVNAVDELGRNMVSLGAGNVFTGVNTFKNDGGIALQDSAGGNSTRLKATADGLEVDRTIVAKNGVKMGDNTVTSIDTDGTTVISAATAANVMATSATVYNGAEKGLYDGVKVKGDTTATHTIKTAIGATNNALNALTTTAGNEVDSAKVDVQWNSTDSTLATVLGNGDYSSNNYVTDGASVTTVVGALDTALKTTNDTIGARAIEAGTAGTLAGKTIGTAAGNISVVDALETLNATNVSQNGSLNTLAGLINGQGVDAATGALTGTATTLSTGFTATNLVAAANELLTDITVTTDGNYIKADKTAAENLGILDGQIKAYTDKVEVVGDPEAAKVADGGLLNNRAITGDASVDGHITLVQAVRDISATAAGKALNNTFTGNNEFQGTTTFTGATQFNNASNTFGATSGSQVIIDNGGNIKVDKKLTLGGANAISGSEKTLDMGKNALTNVAGLTLVNGSADVALNADASGNLVVDRGVIASSLGIGTAGTEFTVDTSGNTKTGTLQIGAANAITGTASSLDMGANDLTNIKNLTTTGNATIAGTLSAGATTISALGSTSGTPVSALSVTANNTGDGKSTSFNVTSDGVSVVGQTNLQNTKVQGDLVMSNGTTDVTIKTASVTGKLYGGATDTTKDMLTVNNDIFVGGMVSSTHGLGVFSDDGDGTYTQVFDVNDDGSITSDMFKTDNSSTGNTVTIGKDANTATSVTGTLTADGESKFAKDASDVYSLDVTNSAVTANKEIDAKAGVKFGTATDEKVMTSVEQGAVAALNATGNDQKLVSAQSLAETRDAINADTRKVMGSMYDINDDKTVSYKNAALAGTNGFATGALSLTGALTKFANNVQAAMGTTYAADGTYTNGFAKPDAVDYDGLATNQSLVAAISQLDKNIGTAIAGTDRTNDAFDTSAAKTVNENIAALDAAIGGDVANQYNGVMKTKSINQNIDAISATLGRMDYLSTEAKTASSDVVTRGNLTNANNTPLTDDLTVADALSNLDKTLGRIHGLYDGTKVNVTDPVAYPSVTGAHSNLAQGTTVENHLVSLDNAIGSRNIASANEDINTAVNGDATAAAGTEARHGSLALGLQTVGDKIGDMNFAGAHYITAGSDLSSSVRTLDSNLYRVEQDVRDLKRDFNRGMASMAAMSALVPNPRAAGNTSLSVGTGAYSGHTAMAIGGFHHINDNVMLNAGAAWGNSRDVAYRLGVTWSW